MLKLNLAGEVDSVHGVSVRPEVGRSTASGSLGEVLYKERKRERERGCMIFACSYQVFKLLAKKMSHSPKGTHRKFVSCVLCWVCVLVLVPLSFDVV